MPLLLFWPLVPFLALCALVVYWVAVAAFLYSAGDISPVQLTASVSDYTTLAVRVLLFPDCYDFFGRLSSCQLSLGNVIHCEGCIG